VPPGVAEQSRGLRDRHHPAQVGLRLPAAERRHHVPRLQDPQDGRDGQPVMALQDRNGFPPSVNALEDRPRNPVGRGVQIGVAEGLPVRGNRLLIRALFGPLLKQLRNAQALIRGCRHPRSTATLRS
jgi:hypothetical protein